MFHLWQHHNIHLIAEKLNKPYNKSDTGLITGGGPSLQSRYVTSLYFTLSTITSIGFGNVSATTDAEKIFTIVMMIAGCKFCYSFFKYWKSLKFQIKIIYSKILIFATNRWK